MNVLSDNKQRELRMMFSGGVSTRQAARRVGCSKITANKYQRQVREARQHTQAEVASVKEILAAGPRYWDGFALDQGRKWSGADDVILTKLWGAGAGEQRCAPILGRKPSTILHRVQYLHLRMPLCRRKAAGRKPREILAYPFIAGRARDEHALVLAVNKAVPRGIPESIRADLCQEMLLALLDDRLATKDLSRSVPIFLRQWRRDYQAPYGTISLDSAPAWNDQARSLHETIPAETALWAEGSAA